MMITSMIMKQQPLRLRGQEEEEIEDNLEQDQESIQLLRLEALQPQLLLQHHQPLQQVVQLFHPIINQDKIIE